MATEQRAVSLESTSLAIGRGLFNMSSYSLPFQSDRHTLHPPVLVTVSSAGAGDSLPVWLLALCGAFTAVGSSCLLLGIVQAAKLRPATGVSVMSITLQLKNYRKPSLQRAVVRIMVMSVLLRSSKVLFRAVCLVRTRAEGYTGSRYTPSPHS